MLNYYYCPAEGGSCTSNNGNMLRQKITAGGALLATQDYAYDVLDRLKTATEGEAARLCALGNPAACGAFQ